MSKGDPIQLEAAEHISEKWLKKYQKICNSNVRIHICGSIRRKEKMVRDIDILVIDSEMHGTFQRGAKFEGVELNLCFVKPECEGAGLLFLTGDHKFNIALRAKAKKMGFKLNRYGLWKGDVTIAGKTEESIFTALEMDYVPSEGRKSPNGQKGISVQSGSVLGDRYEVFITDLHGFNFCSCRGFQYRRSCRHLDMAKEQV